MKRDNVNYLLIGVFVVVMAIGFMVLLVAITGRSGPTDRYIVHYDNVAGLKFGTGVFYEGYRVGQIESLRPAPGPEGMRYEVEMSVAAGWRIPDDSVASVRSAGLISAVTIEITEGESDTMLAPGAEIRGQGQTDLFSVLNQAAGDFRQLSQDGILPVLNNVNQRVSEVAEALLSFRRDELSPFVAMLHKRVDQDLIGSSVELISTLDESARGLQAMLGSDNQARVGQFLVHIDDVALNLNELVSRIETTRRQMDGVLAALDGMVTGNRAGVDGAVDAAETSMQELEVALKTLNQHLGTILGNVEGGSRHMSEFARAIRDNPARLIRSSEAAEPGQP